MTTIVTGLDYIRETARLH